MIPIRAGEALLVVAAASADPAGARPVNWGLVGLGRFAATALMPAAGRSQNARILACAGRTIEATQAFAAHFEIPRLRQHRRSGARPGDRRGADRDPQRAARRDGSHRCHGREARVLRETAGAHRRRRDCRRAGLSRRRGAAAGRAALAPGKQPAPDRRHPAQRRDRRHPYPGDRARRAARRARHRGARTRAPAAALATMSARISSTWCAPGRLGVVAVTGAGILYQPPRPHRRHDVA